MVAGMSALRMGLVTALFLVYALVTGHALSSHCHKDFEPCVYCSHNSGTREESDELQAPGCLSADSPPDPTLTQGDGALGAGALAVFCFALPSGPGPSVIASGRSTFDAITTEPMAVRAADLESGYFGRAPPSF
jgi:hypothetical protein